MKKILFMAVAAIAVLSGCSSDNDPIMGETGKEALTFTATMEGVATTRATFDDTKKCAAWEEGDKISINGKIYSAQAAGTTTTTFKADGEGATGPYNAYFPADLYNGTPTLPANISETWADGKFNMPMYATSATTELAFNNLCGVLKVTVTSGQLASVKSITVSSTNCATSGAFTVVGNAAKLTEASKTANTVTVTYTTAVSTDAKGKVFYIAIPAQTYKNLSIAVSDGTTTKVMTTKKDQNITVNRNTVYPISFDGEPTKGTTERTGGTAGWVQLWGGGPKFAEYNVGATSATDYGGYYTWGGTYKNGDGITWSDDHNTTNDGSGNLSSTDDTATKLWGSNWRMPTSDELGKKENNQYIDGLLGKCTCVWTPNYNSTGVNGLLCTGKGAYASNSVFLPVAGYYSNGSINYPSYGMYWSSTPYNNTAYRLNFAPSNQGMIGYTRSHACSVRAVLAE